MSTKHALDDSASRFLRRFPPFDRLERAHLDFLTSHLSDAHFAAGATVLAPEQGAAEFLHIVHDGVVTVEASAGEDGGDVEYGPGESFPLSALITKRAVASVHRAARDTDCYLLPAQSFSALLKLSSAFAEFCGGVIATQLEQSLQLLRQQYSSADSQDSYTTLSSVIRRQAVSFSPDTPIGAVLERMSAEGVGSVVVEDEARRPLGIFTMKEVLEKVALRSADLSLPISSVMNAEFTTLPPNATSYEAALVMAKHGLRHIPVVENDRLVGVVSESNLFSLQRVGLRRISNAIRAAKSIEALVQVGRDIHLAAVRMIEQGVTAEHLTQFVSTMNDLLTSRLIDLEFFGAGMSASDICWIGMGSEGRFEQTLHTDQDNGIIFPSHEEPDSVRDKLLPLAKRINDALARCGFPICKGGIMAGNPLWCLSLNEWKAKFADWIHHADPVALLNATIFFDFRPLHGDLDLARKLRTWLTAHAVDNKRFLLQMTQNALQNQPPLGLIRDFVLPSGGEHPNQLDLKVNGITPFVDAARIYSLAAGIEHTSTLKRLRESRARLNVHATEVEAWGQAFLFIQLLRLRQQQAAHRERREMNNFLDPAMLNEMDRRMLKEAMRQARKLQTRLERDFAAGTVGFGA
jgi:CBS domain-containing protein